MHFCEPYGHLVINGQPYTSDQLARSTARFTEAEILPLVEELRSFGVLSETAGHDSLPDGIIYSRRMVRDYAKLEQDRLNGKKALETLDAVGRVAQRRASSAERQQKYRKRKRERNEASCVTPTVAPRVTSPSVTSNRNAPLNSETNSIGVTGAHPCPPPHIPSSIPINNPSSNTSSAPPLGSSLATLKGGDEPVAPEQETMRERLCRENREASMQRAGFVLDEVLTATNSKTQNESQREVEQCQEVMSESEILRQAVRSAESVR